MSHFVVPFLGLHTSVEGKRLRGRVGVPLCLPGAQGAVPGTGNAVLGRFFRRLLPSAFLPLRGTALVLLAAAGIDVLATGRVLSLGAGEANPVMRAVFERGFCFGCAAQAVADVWGACFLAWAARFCPAARWGLVVCAAVQTLVAAWGLLCVWLLGAA